MRKNCIAIIGARGAGKSKLSRKFAKMTGRLVLSTDTLVCYEAGGIPVSEIVRMYGWNNFRDREFELLGKLKSMQNVVIDCGGGMIVEAPEAEGAEESFSRRKVDLLKSFSRVLYIKRDLDWLLSRSLKDSNRPDLNGHYENVLLKRLPWYEAAADEIVDMRGLDADLAAEHLAGKYP